MSNYIIAERDDSSPFWSARLESSPDDFRIGSTPMDAVAKLLIEHPEIKLSQCRIDTSRSSRDRVVLLIDPAG